MHRIADDLTGEARRTFEGIVTQNWTLPKGIEAAGIKPWLWLKEVGKGRLVYHWPNHDGAHDIQPGRAFGGWVAALSDHVVSLCMISALEEGEAFTTQDLQIKLFRPVGEGVIEITASVVNRSRTTGYVEAEWRLPDGRLAAKVLAWKAIRSREALSRPPPSAQ